MLPNTTMFSLCNNFQTVFLCNFSYLIHEIVTFDEQNQNSYFSSLNGKTEEQKIK